MTEKRINIMDPEIAVAKPAEPETPKVEYASVAERFVALLIDYSIIFMPLQLVVSVILRKFGPDMELWQVLGLFVGINLVFVLYETIFSSGDRVTLGKGLIGIAVVKKDLSGPISLQRAFLRAIGYYFSALLLMCGFVLAFFDDKHRALQDFFGGSVVVAVRQRSWGERFSVRALGICLLLLFSWIAYTQYFGGRSLLQQYYVSHAEKHLKNIGLLEEAHYQRYGYYTNDLLRLSLLSGDPVQFQRDTQEILAPKGFKIGVQGDTYRITAIAKDDQQTPVYYSPHR